MDSALPLTRVTEFLLDAPTTVEQSRGRRFEARYVTITDTLNKRPWDQYRQHGFAYGVAGSRRVYVCGPTIKKDGTFGQLLGGESWYVPSRTEQLPGWLDEIVSQVPHALNDGLV
jgi:hypothetical protein